MKAIVDADACIGCGLCADTCAEVFKMEDDKAIVVAGNIPDAVSDSCQEAADSCPTDAIKVE